MGNLCGGGGGSKGTTKGGGGSSGGGSNGTAAPKKEGSTVGVQDAPANMQAKEFKLLLLGAGDSGKSTFFKQIKLLHHIGYTDMERDLFKTIIYCNVMESMKALLAAAESLGFSLSEANTECGEKIKNAPKELESLPADLVGDLMALWKDKAILSAFERAADFKIAESTKYFFEALDRIAAPDFMPDDHDILNARVKTTGILEAAFTFLNVKFSLFDVGGQKSERRKWVNCFNGVTAVIFCVSLNEYDQNLEEEENMNRMHESLQLFDETCNRREFQNTPFILFLNKTDLFRRKIEKIDLKVCFPEYSGGCDYEKAVAFIQEKFLSMNKNKDKPIYPHFTCATDRQNVSFVFDAVKDIVLQRHGRKG